MAFFMCVLFAVFSCTDSDKASADALDPIVKVYDDAVVAVDKTEDADSLISVVNGVKRDVLAAVEQFKASGKSLSSADKIEAMRAFNDIGTALYEFRRHIKTLQEAYHKAELYQRNELAEE